MPVSDPKEFPAAFRDAWMARDGDAIGALFDEDADFVNVVGIWWEDRPAIARAHGYALKSFFSETRLTLGRVKVRQLGADHALVHARLRLSGQRAPDGSVAESRSTILSFVLARHDDGWLGVSAQNTDIVPGAETLRAGPDGLTPEDYRR
ncbi:SgcJ/EcaC family oxidoreductase [Alphaproteobacteria bacterium GH1-50]|uniref:SgcJ/EcaC family oxidoreductase n=1 Tax=Kangsaoukella pontilimi TaxID=2691042 RepID=A0A7C9M8F1_9RHOB|nr:SgcJ/EcaC family oxidoreductase [Kangsaoukella pontilimi]MXQ06633.1 SgcJ/EcaC family oxidoreductase [Kangsaoukella pontilimi]